MLNMGLFFPSRADNHAFLSVYTVAEKCLKIKISSIKCANNSMSK